ncbi:DUF2637 domain-containing protein [Streptomyces rubradiris]|uniref:DUF2637 domain-containing protein n=1 Tax=Streptomyces rubradiris TaxID=285531 RepID=A0ABQ3RA25_STRRR|nr:DUF2637 domain-containing protein [Streptomyces rubradiris]GHH25733.1 hypothetical protein GCM10018792_65110 [Streptomyces rubradiris]GHI52716.1 hypothetical protein Srubr_25620 [Streptomyces rubradiris]
MSVDKLVLPAGIGFAALCVLGVVALVLRSRRNREQDKLSAEERERLADERRKSWRRRLAVISLSVAFLIIFCIAGIAAWLSFGAQKAYAFDRNGGSWDAATGFALLLDAGALGLSLLRLFEALTARSSQLTRFYLVAFVVASATMNLLHAPSHSIGGRLVAVIPPLVYAVFLETLLKKVEQLVLGKYPKRKVKKNAERGYSLLLWVPFVGYPRQMWKLWRNDLHSTMENVRAPGSRRPLPRTAPAPSAPQTVEPPRPQGGVEPSWQPAEASVTAPVQAAPAPVPRPVSRQQPPAASALPKGAPPPIGTAAVAAPSLPSPTPQPATPAPQPPVQAQSVPPPLAPAGKSKKDMLRDALVAQIQAGDLRVLDDNSHVSNGAAYQANRQLGKAAGKGTKNGRQEGLMAEGAVRTAVKQLLPDLRQIAEELERARLAAAAVQQKVPEAVPDHQDAAHGGANGMDEPGERHRQDVPGIGHQHSEEAGVSRVEKEAALA